MHSESAVGSFTIQPLKFDFDGDDVVEDIVKVQ